MGRLELTYKSNKQILDDHVGADPPRIVKFLPRFDRDEGEKRRLWMLPELHQWLHAPEQTRKLNDYKANIRTWLGTFVKGAEFNNCDDLKLLEPYDRDLWELKVRFEPQLRIFGALLWKDTFFCMNKAFRDDLKIKGSKKWIAAEDEAIEMWETLFGSNRRYRGRPFSNCISGGRDLCQR